jgi:hypothetical protein
MLLYNTDNINKILLKNYSPDINQIQYSIYNQHLSAYSTRH